MVTEVWKGERYEREIKCPNCGEVFTVNESQYVELLSPIEEPAKFDKAPHDRMKQELALAGAKGRE